MMTLSAKKTSRQQRLRKLAYAPLVAAVAAGALCTAIGSASALDANAGTAPPETAASKDCGAYWQIVNRTGQPVSGNWIAHGFQYESVVHTDQIHPWAIDQKVCGDTTPVVPFFVPFPNVPWEGHICYNNHWWDFDRRSVNTNRWSLEVDSRGTLHAVYQDASKAVFDPLHQVVKIPMTVNMASAC
ncbi:hypothetical protein R3Q06_33130 [Rhodococcus erythropolis]|uniref:hypothetical protein n=1 Tax=Rhodococcus erythropolis TaxID=1833 RepID=UPI00294A7D96|nr:hypothetical protein [Rhodococcus erythropolis]MDV6278291.1 hypothetical protein [Rhodococcus erythropolis]